MGVKRPPHGVGPGAAKSEIWLDVEHLENRQISTMPNFVSIAAAAEHLKSANRVSVIGSSAGGKSTLSRMISQAHSLPHISIDREIRWLPGWKIRDYNQQRAKLQEFISQDKWILDGTSVSSFETRIPRSDIVLWVRPTRMRAMWQLSKRVACSYGQVRSDMADGCPEQLPDLEFLRYIWTFDKLQSPRIVDAINRFGPNTPVFEILKNSDAEMQLSLSLK